MTCKYATRQRGLLAHSRKTHGLLLIVLLLSGGVQLNPGPVNPRIQLDSGVEPHLGMTPAASHDEVRAWGFPVDINAPVHDISTLFGGDFTRSTTAPATTLKIFTCHNPVVRKQTVYRMFQTVNHP